MAKSCLCTEAMFCQQCNPELWAEHKADMDKFYGEIVQQLRDKYSLCAGQYFQHGELPHIVARVDEINAERGETFVLFSIRDRNHPEMGWSSGAALVPEMFLQVYPTRLEAKNVEGPQRIRLVATHDMVMPDNLDFVSSGAAEALLKSAMVENEVKYRWEEIRE